MQSSLNISFAVKPLPERLIVTSNGPFAAKDRLEAQSWELVVQMDEHFKTVNTYRIRPYTPGTAETVLSDIKAGKALPRLFMVVSERNVPASEVGKTSGINLVHHSVLLGNCFNVKEVTSRDTPLNACMLSHGCSSIHSVRCFEDILHDALEAVQGKTTYKKGDQATVSHDWVKAALQRMISLGYVEQLESDEMGTSSKNQGAAHTVTMAPGLGTEGLMKAFQLSRKLKP